MSRVSRVPGHVSRVRGVEHRDVPQQPRVAVLVAAAAGVVPRDLLLQKLRGKYDVIKRKYFNKQ